jgi:hypothetical protein
MNSKARNENAPHARSTAPPEVGTHLLSTFAATARVDGRGAVSAYGIVLVRHGRDTRRRPA